MIFCKKLKKWYLIHSLLEKFKFYKRYAYNVLNITKEKKIEWYTRVHKIFEEKSK
jgi:hypothetical protein